MTDLPDIVTLFAATRSIIPVSIDKAGLVKWRELQERRLTLDELRGYADAPAFAHITGQISNLFTIDIDNVGIDWSKSRKLYELAHRQTPSGGLHLDVALPRGWAVKNTVGVLAPGIDTRGEGGIALICGRSRRGEYSWLRPFEDSPIRFAELPLPVQWALNENCKKEKREVIIDFSQRPVSEGDMKNLLLKALARAPMNGRNPTGFWLACRLRDFGVNKEQARSIGYQYVDRVWATNTHGAYEAYTQKQFDASLENAYAGVAK